MKEIKQLVKIANITSSRAMKYACLYVIERLKSKEKPVVDAYKEEAKKLVEEAKQL